MSQEKLDNKIEKKQLRKTTKKVGGKKKKKKVVVQPLRLKEFYEIYKVWKTLPPMWKGMTAENLEKMYSVDDPYIVDLLQIKNQSQFAERFKMSIETLTDWNRRMDDEGIDYLDEIRKWADKLTKNVVMAHYNKLIRKFDPVSGDIWYKTISKFSEKKEIAHSGKLSLLDLAKELDDEEQATIKKATAKDKE